MKGRYSIARGDENELKTKLLRGTIMVLIDASDISFQMYQSGVYKSSLCKESSVNHAVQLVGYGVSADTDYWIIKNSWGKPFPIELVRCCFIGFDGFLKALHGACKVSCTLSAVKICAGSQVLLCYLISCVEVLISSRLRRQII